MSDIKGYDEASEERTGIARRAMLGHAVALSAGAAIAGNLALPAWADTASDRRLRIYEGKYAIDSHKIVDGYFAFPRGRTAMDVLVVLPGAAGVDDTARALVRRHALSGKIAFAPDLARTAGTSLASRDAMIADFIAHTPRLKRFARGNGNVTVVSA